MRSHVVSTVRVRVQLQLLSLACIAAVADTGAQGNQWRRCSTDTSTAAIEACTSVIFLDPSNDGAYINRGIAFRRAGNLDLAIRDYDEAIRLNPSAADAFNNRGNAYRDREQFDLAMHDYDEALRLNPRYAHAYNNRGIISLERDDATSADEDFSRAIREDPSYANAFRNRGLARLDLRRFDSALSDFDMANRLNPEMGRGAEYALALFGRGMRRGLEDVAAQRDIEEATRLLPNVAQVMAEEIVQPRARGTTSQSTVLVSARTITLS